MLFHAHSGLRYLVLLAGIAAIAYAVYGVATKRPYDKTMRILAAGYTGMVDLTALSGVAYMFSGVFYPQLGGHIVMMILAAVIAHVVSGVMRRRPMKERTFMPHVIGTAVSLGLVVAGILALGRPIVG